MGRKKDLREAAQLDIRAALTEDLGKGLTRIHVTERCAKDYARQAAAMRDQARELREQQPGGGSKGGR